MDIFKLTAVQLGKMIKDGEITSVEATKALIEKIKTVDAKFNAYISLDEEDAINSIEQYLSAK